MRRPATTGSFSKCAYSSRDSACYLRGYWQATDRRRKGIILPLRVIPAPTFNELVLVVADTRMPQYVLLEPEHGFY